MKKLQGFIKLKKIVSIGFVVLSVLFLVSIILFKDSLQNYASDIVKAQAGTNIQNAESAFIDSAYNYSKNGLSYETTFLEFGSKNCSACKKMEWVMSDIRNNYKGKVNVVFYNVMELRTQNLMKYYGIAAIPTQVLLDKEGKEYFRHIGFYSSEEIIKKLTLK